MADDKKTQLSIVIRTVDQATAKIKAINDRLDAVTKPARDFKKALSNLKEKSGLDDIIGGFKSVRHALGGVLSKVEVLGGVLSGALAAAGAGLLKIALDFDDLGDSAERFGVSVDFLAQMRYAAVKAGAPVESLDQGLRFLSINLGRARANTGRLTAFLLKANPALLHQLKAAKSNEAAFNLLARAMAKLHDPAKRAALAQMAFGNADLAPLLAQGADGIKKLRDRYVQLAGSQKDAADKGGDVDDAMHDLHASLDGVKAALVSGLGPAMTAIIRKIGEFATAHRAEIAAWAKRIGEELPGAVKKLWAWLERVANRVESFVDAIGGIKNAAIGAAAVIAGPLILSVVKLSTALVTAILRAGKLGKALAGLPSGGVGGAAGAEVATATAGARTVGLTGVLGAAAAPAALGLGAYYGLKAVGADREGLMSRLLRVQDKANPKDSLQAKLQGVAQLMRGERPSYPVVESPFAGLAGHIYDAAAQSLSAQARGALGGAGAATAPQPHAKVTVDFANAPRGTRVKTDPQSTAHVDLSVGYQMGTP